MVPAEHHGHRLLAIDDSMLIHRLLRARLKHERIEIRTASTGHEGLELALELQPDVILLDIDLPDMTGFDVLHELKSDTRTHDIPVIFISGSAGTDSKVRGLEMGAIDFVTKPFDLAELKARVRVAVRIRSLITMLAQRAQIDGLTGLWNRTYFNDRLAQEIDEARRHDLALSLIFCDIDHFKRINDAHGHPFGDRVLEEFAMLLNQGRSGDIACRYGGEEFVVILPQATAEDAANVADRHRRAFEQLDWDCHPGLRLTASFGVTDLSRLEEISVESMINSADEALYQAKNGGRNCVVVAPPPTTARLTA